VCVKASPVEAALRRKIKSVQSRHLSRAEPATPAERAYRERQRTLQAATRDAERPLREREASFNDQSAKWFAGEDGKPSQLVIAASDAFLAALHAAHPEGGHRVA
jgi:hypothetical protein